MRQLPPPEEIARIRREALLGRAVEAYKFFYPTLSMALNFEALEEYGARANRGFLIQLTTPDLVVLTQNSDTPYGLGWGDASDGPVVVEIPKGPVMGVVDDMNFQFVTNMGLVGEEAGAGAKYVFLPPGYDGTIPDGYLARRLKTNHFLICARAPFPDPQQGLDFLRTLRIYPLAEAADPPANAFTDLSDRKAVANLAYFRVYGPGKAAFDGSWKPSDFESA
jgi:hypothetical protein